MLRINVTDARDTFQRTSALCVRGPYYECNVRGYAVIPGVDIRSCLYRSSDRLVKAKFTKTLTF